MSASAMTVDQAVDLARECIRRCEGFDREWMEVRGGKKHAEALLVLIAQVKSVQALRPTPHTEGT